ncbi:urea ABC transporter permease subunit UrtC [Halalkalibacterium halodurans]|uniref:ABC transporter (Permease) n=1 Tax=Halalkalibacterium halodurans (strain ATCC BAA-125 / DSM 18197 / FERM 7344 / JCM 9153 / C-125) TaxID=272558 RepID=Q9KG64_HALH5|nr:urea ABC transporter permease subunit UrtC [Halalkalibacterium halodurans]MED4084840.1 urea ABC transporter permease subunit UrtC [Halalkalibacterium halodurans]MED4108475.1 urea ABC transporter permease subunit UrtC [Halalkalibacterium halodurans]MED4124783.1 urea ABC transporter permease subunit UrtC [Halalkalibacterium halodurans]MED4150813.1 urea ABC transporter permease subunit UrtC [Halalkalibacterium halodurans]MED4174312.1 urea ABC transporter permease subunit UrtC [Halalkalibacteri
MTLQLIGTRLFTRQWLMFLIIVLLLVLPFFLSDFRTNLLGRYIAFAILVLGLDLLWGYTGVLSLGHGIFFGLGAYIMAMYLSLEGMTGAVPDFMLWNGITGLPLLWQVFSNPFIAIIGAVTIPMLIASLLAFFTFRNRIKDVYFTILTQALVLVMVTLIVSQQSITGGTNGLTGFSTIFGYSLSSASTQQVLYYLTLGCLILVFLLCAALVNSRFGRALVAIRDGENRLRFSGYDTSMFKVAIFTLSAGIAGLAGMLYVLQVGMITPSMIGIIPSIEMILWVAIGGRGTLIGPVIGALVTNSAKTFFSESHPEAWLYLLGTVFVVIVLFLPGGIMSLLRKWRKRGERNESDGVKRTEREETHRSQVS